MEDGDASVCWSLVAVWLDETKSHGSSANTLFIFILVTQTEYVTGRRFR